MHNQPYTVRFSLRAIFVGMFLVGIGVVTLKYSYSWVLFLVNLGVIFSIVFALISAWAGTGNRRLFYATYGVTAMTIFVMIPISELAFLPVDWLESIYSAIHSEDGWSAGNSDTGTWFVVIIWRWEVVVLSIAAAYIIPWLVTRSNTDPP